MNFITIIAFIVQPVAAILFKRPLLRLGTWLNYTPLVLLPLPAPVAFAQLSLLHFKGEFPITFYVYPANCGRSEAVPLIKAHSLARPSYRSIHTQSLSRCPHCIATCQQQTNSHWRRQWCLCWVGSRTRKDIPWHLIRCHTQKHTLINSLGCVTKQSVHYLLLFNTLLYFCPVSRSIELFLSSGWQKHTHSLATHSTAAAAASSRCRSTAMLLFMVLLESLLLIKFVLAIYWSVLLPRLLEKSLRLWPFRNPFEAPWFAIE